MATPHLTSVELERPLAAVKQNQCRLLVFDVNENGKAILSSVVKSSGHPALDEAARSGIAKCTFKPALAGGKPVSASVKVQYVWSLN
ncbi:energy transducer TonB [Janthinobacterium lividum]|nr:energy transducer TonB [Janthinobacterium lividum]